MNVNSIPVIYSRELCEYFSVVNGAFLSTYYDMFIYLFNELSIIASLTCNFPRCTSILHEQ